MNENQFYGLGRGLIIRLGQTHLWQEESRQQDQHGEKSAG
jgi:hypothetical protein